MSSTSKEPIGWFSLKGGKRIPIFEGESKADAIKRAVGNKPEQSNAKSVIKSEFRQKSASEQTKDADDKKDTEIQKASENIKKLNDEQKYRDALASDKKVEIKNGKMYFNGKEVDKLDTSEAGEKGKDSLAEHVDNNGNITAERMRVHQQIIEEQFKGHKPYGPEDEKVAMFTGGGGASGKGVFTKVRDDGHRNIGDFYSQDKKPLVIDPDNLKGALARADGHDSLDAKLSAYYHEESSALAKQIYATSLKNSYPTLYDGTATGEGIYGLNDKARSYGYKTEMNFIYSDWKTVRQNSLDRYEATGRLVPINRVVGAHTKAYDSVVNLQDKFDSFKLYDNAGRNLKLVGSQTGGKKLDIVDSASFERFSKSKAEFTLSAREIEKYELDADKITARRAKHK